MIKLGCCIPGGSLMPEGEAAVPQSNAELLVSRCRHVLNCGFDFTECSGALLTSLTPEELAWVASENQKESLGMLASNSLYPPQFCISNPGDGWDALMEYTHKLIDALALMGIRYAVFGSGNARSIPDGMDQETGLANLRRFMTAFAEYAGPKGVTMVIEPLRTSECNVFCTVPVCDEEVRRLNNPAIQLLADSFHMAHEKTEPEAVEACAGRLMHCHISEAPDRTYPGLFTTGDPAYNQRFAKALLRMGYEGGVSAECAFPDFEANVPEIYAYMSKIFR